MKKLPHLSGMRQWIYTAKTMHYSWQTVVKATTIQQARVLGYKEALGVMGNHARIHTDDVIPLE
jgi:ribosomal protein L15E